MLYKRRGYEFETKLSLFEMPIFYVGIQNLFSVINRSWQVKRYKCKELNDTTIWSNIYWILNFNFLFIILL